MKSELLNLLQSHLAKWPDSTLEDKNSALMQERLVDYVLLLHKWNKAYNLTSVRDPKDMLVKHILDSLVVSPHLDGYRFIDVGTGPGLPGIPLAIANPDKTFFLLDSLGKRIRFLRQVVYSLGLTNVELVQSRVELYQPEQGFDGVISRAFASLEDMISWCDHLVEPNFGRFFALKGQYPSDEMQHLPEGTIVNSVKSLSVPGLEGARHLIVLSK